MTVRQRPLDPKFGVEVDQPPAGQHRADRVDDLDRQMREVADRLVLDPAVLAV